MIIVKGKNEKERLEAISKQVGLHGKVYIPAIVPPELPRGRVGDCFDWTLVQAMMNRKYKYVEGVAKRPSNDEWVLHAWLTDGEHVFDLTWGMYFKDKTVVLPLPTLYYGVEMETSAVVDFYRSVKYKSVLWNGWRDEERAKKILPLGFIIN